jgi:AraC-like DNA-binding protein
LKLFSTDAPALFFAVYVRKDWLEKRAHTSGRPFLFPSPRIAISPELRASLWQLLDLMMFRPGQHELLDAAVQELITVSVQASLIAKAPGAKPVAGPLLSHKLRLAVGLMRERVDIRSTIDEIATEAGLSRARLFALFRDQLNTTPQVFWSAIRLEEAIREVMNGDVPLVSVAHELGFSAASNFSRFFKEHTGVSPSDYRRAANAASVQPLTGLPL